MTRDLTEQDRRWLKEMDEAFVSKHHVDSWRQAAHRWRRMARQESAAKRVWIFASIVLSCLILVTWGGILYGCLK